MVTSTPRCGVRGKVGTVQDLKVDPELNEWLEQVWARRGSDLLLLAGRPARTRVDGELEDIAPETVREEVIRRCTRSLVTDEQAEEFEVEGDCDFAFTWEDKARIRGNAYHQRGEAALALRLIPKEIPSFDELGLPESVRELARMTRGFVLVTGQTGAGKTTTLASLCKEIIETRPCHVLTIEDPIEFVQESKRASVSQREVGRDAASFASALRAALREDPDVILLGEMRDPESIETALTLAETGHLVFATLHTNDAAQAIDRIIDAVPVAKTNQVRAQLAAGLTAVVSQRLLPRKGGGRQIVVFEVMIATTAVRNLVREGRLNQLARLIATGEREGMVALNTSLATAVAAGDLDEEIALATSADSGGLILQLARLRGGPSH